MANNTLEWTNNSGVGILIIDIDTEEIVYYNAFVAEAAGYSPEELQGRTLKSGSDVSKLVRQFRDEDPDHGTIIATAKTKKGIQRALVIPILVLMVDDSRHLVLMTKPISNELLPDGVSFEKHTGRLKISGRDKRGQPHRQTLMRVTREGIRAWNDIRKEEIEFPWEVIEALVACMS